MAQGGIYTDNTVTGGQVHFGPIVYQAADSLLADLRTTDPHDDKKRIETRDSLLSDAYRWILDHPEFQRWQSEPPSRLLWIKGDPGKGKTMLLCGIIDHLEQISDTDKGLLSYFFCQATDSHINNATAVLRGLIFLLIRQQPSLISHVQEKYRHAKSSLFTDRNAWIALSDIFKDILRDTRIRSVYLVVDALDECLNHKTGGETQEMADLPQLLELINWSLSETHCVKWIVSSRNVLEIKEHLRADDQKTEVSLEENAQSIATAVDIYIRHKVSELSNFKDYSRETEHTVRNYLSLNAQDTFLWVALVCRKLRTVPEWDVLANLTALPRGLNQLYDRMIQQVANSDSSALCKRILGIATNVRRPLALQELAAIADIPVGISRNSKWLKDIISLCGSFLTVREQTSLPFEDEGHNHSILLRSLRIMSNTLRRDIYRLGHPGFSVYDVNLPDEDPLHMARYSCVYWIDHLCDSIMVSDSVVESGTATQRRDSFEGAESFFRHCYLYWLEALSLLRSMPEAVLSMTKLDNFLQGRGETSQLAPLVRDAERFLRYHGSVIEKYPLQTYASALLFSPARSITRLSFQNEEPDWIAPKPIMEDDWGACQQTLEGHSNWVQSVAFSRDSKLIASASDDTTIRLWDSETGKCLQTLRDHYNRVSSVAFSHHSSLLASGSDDCTIKIWDTTTYQCLQTLEGHSQGNNPINSVAFSYDDEHLASASGHGVVKIWDILSSKYDQTLENTNDRAVLSVAFSHRSRRIALISDDSFIRIWDYEGGRYVKVSEGFEGSQGNIVFSNDDRYLASATYYNTVKLWDIETGVCRQIFEGHNSMAISVAFSQDSKFLASGSTDNTVKVWSMQSGQCLQTFKGHRSTVTSVAFSGNSERIASASGDGTVKVWLLKQAQESQIGATVLNHHGPVDSITLSHNLELLASSSKDVKIWDANTGQCLQTLSGCGRSVFSHDDKHLASPSTGYTIGLWDTVTGKRRQIFEGHDHFIQGLAFSHDSKLIVSASRDTTVRLWDSATGQCQRVLSHQRAFWVIFSYDSKSIASATYYLVHDALKLWDVETGQCLFTVPDRGLTTSCSPAFSRDSKQIVSVTEENAVEIRDVASGTRIQRFGGHMSHISSVAISLDSTLVASASYDETLKIWDARTGVCRQTLNVSSVLRQISFSPSSRLLYTEIGAIRLDIQSALDGQRYHRQGCGISGDGTWIMWNSENLLWLPAEYRPRCSTVAESTVAIGCAGGQVLIMNFSADKLSRMRRLEN